MNYHKTFLILSIQVQKIKYQIATSNPVSLKIYDVLGNEVPALVNEVQSTGNYEVTFDASSLSSGTYFYRLQTGSLVESFKMDPFKVTLAEPFIDTTVVTLN